MRGKETDRAAEIWKKKRRWERMREDVEFCLLENVRSYLRITEWLTSARKPLEIQGFRAFMQFRKTPLQHFCNSEWKKRKKEWLQVVVNR